MNENVSPLLAFISLVEQRISDLDLLVEQELLTLPEHMSSPRF
jgi:hypothetical protein